MPSKYDIFISYGHLDDEDPAGDVKGWVDRISTKNRVGFSTGSEAVSHGFKPCRICSPAT
jgi:hypothetical protein